MPHFQDIPQFPRASYEVDIPLESLRKTLDSAIDEDGLDIDPDFQRGHVWTDEQRIAYCEYFLRGGEMGRVLIFNHPRWTRVGVSNGYNDYVLVDGKQRLTALLMFMSDVFPVFGYKRSAWQGRLGLSHMVKWRVITLPSRADVLRYYLDLNAGGTPHAAAEIERVRALLQALT